MDGGRVIRLDSQRKLPFRLSPWAWFFQVSAQNDIQKWPFDFPFKSKYDFMEKHQAFAPCSFQLDLDPAFYLSLIEELPDAIFLTDSLGMIQWANRSFWTWLGLSGNETPKPIGIDSLFQGPNAPPSLGEVANLPDLRWTGESRLVAQAGQTIPIRVTLRGHRDSQNGLMVFSFRLTDLTETRRVDSRLRMFELAVENCLEPIVITEAEPIDLPGPRMVYVNKAFTEVTGYTREEALGQSPRILQGPKSQRKELDKIRVALTRWKTIKVELLNYRKDGTEFWVELGIFPVADETGWYTHWVAVQRDITQKKLFEETIQESNRLLEERVNQRTLELTKANADLSKADRLKDEFLASMSHELRTPLNGVLGLVEAIREGVYGNVPPEFVAPLGDISNSGKHLLSLINDILDLSKAQAGQIELQREAVSVSEMCHASIRMIKEMAQKKGQTIELNLEGAPGCFLADERRFKQILVNLLGNSVKFTPPGGSLGLQVTCDRTQETITFSVWDNGIGIEKSKQELIFQPFQQIDSRLSRHYSGTGLGLALVMKMVELHNGRVELESKEGMGSRFSIHLPWAESHQTEPLASTQALIARGLSPQGGKTTKVGKGFTLLLAEDNDTNARFVMDFLAKQGFLVARAMDGQEAMEMAQEMVPNLILMDIQMPVKDGLEATRTLKADPRTRNIPILAVSALALEGDREKCLEAGADGYLSKPISLRPFLEVILKLLNARKS